METPRSYWLAAVIGALLGAVVGALYQHHVMVKKFHEMREKLVSVSKWKPAEADRDIRDLIAIARSPARVKAARSNSQSADAELVARLAQSNVDGFDDLDQLIGPYQDYRDQRVPVALVFSVPGFLLGLFVAVGIERRAKHRH